MPISVMIWSIRVLEGAAEEGVWGCGIGYRGWWHHTSQSQWNSHRGELFIPAVNSVGEIGNQWDRVRADLRAPRSKQYLPLVLYTISQTYPPLPLPLRLSSLSSPTYPPGAGLIYKYLRSEQYLTSRPGLHQQDFAHSPSPLSPSALLPSELPYLSPRFRADLQVPSE